MLSLEPGFEDGDHFYAELVKACEGVTDEAAPRFFARLCLILANEVREKEALESAIALAAEGLPRREPR